MSSLTIRTRVLVALAACLLFAAVAASMLVGHILERNLEVGAADSLRHAAEGFAALERADVVKLSATLDALGERADIKKAFLAGDR
jgi:hypothetical protein